MGKVNFKIPRESSKKTVKVKSFCRKKPSSKKAYAVGKGLSEMFGGCNNNVLEALISGLGSQLR